MDVEAIERQLRGFFESLPDGIVAVWLFGSTARREAGPGSDVDVAVLYRETPPATLGHPSIRLAGELEKHLGQPVDVIVMNDAPPELVHHVMRDGLLVLECDAGARVRFEVRARNEYFDVLPFLRQYRRGVAG